jgi:hypothetical protein
MTFAGWVAWALVVAGLALTCWGVWADRRDYGDLSADLDDTNDRVDDLRVELSHVLDHLDDDTPTSGRHAATTGTAPSKEPT